jgi:hypothetical protein
MGALSFLFPSRRTSLVQQASRGIAKARRGGRHTYRGEWHFDVEAEAQQISSSLISWCRETIATCRRPFGIDYFDLAVAVFDKQGSKRDEFSLSELRPVVLYDGARLEDELIDFIERRRTQDTLHISTVLFSWGDAAHASLPARI